MAWTVETLNETVDAEPAALPTDMRARLARPTEREGAARPPHPQPALGDSAQGESRHRALYVTAKEQRVVILRAFIKKTEKTPPGEIELALQRAKDVKP